MAKKKKKSGTKLKVVNGGAAGRVPSASHDPETTPVVPPRAVAQAKPAPVGQVAPAEPTAAERRLFRRVPFFRKILYKFETLDQFKSEFANDISLGGMFIKTDKPEPIGTVIYLEFDLKDGSKILSGFGKVVRVNPTGNPDYDPGMGVEFLKFDEESIARIRQLITERFNP